MKQSNGVIGEAASRWTERYAAGRTDEDFAKLIGSNQTTVNECRRVHNRFYRHGGNHKFAWRHWRAMLTWDDAEECLDWAESTGASFGEMNAWRNVRSVAWSAAGVHQFKSIRTAAPNDKTHMNIAATAIRGRRRTVPYNITAELRTQQIAHVNIPYSRVDIRPRDPTTKSELQFASKAKK